MLANYALSQAWLESLPAHLQFTEENLETQVAMFETSSNSGAWCYCFMHAMYPCCYLAILEVSPQSVRGGARFPVIGSTMSDTAGFVPRAREPSRSRYRGSGSS